MIWAARNLNERGGQNNRARICPGSDSDAPGEIHFFSIHFQDKNLSALFN